jgi:hypothetical protein
MTSQDLIEKSIKSLAFDDPKKGNHAFFVIEK